MATCSINSNELEIILTNDAQNTISVDSAIETYSDVLECKIQSKDIILEKVDNSVVVLELTINGSKYVTEATLVDDESSFIKINEETLHLVKSNKSSNDVLEESVEEVEEVKVDELTKFLGEKIEDFTNQKLTEKVEEIKTFSSNTLYENLETFEEKKKDLLELVEEQFTNVVDGVKSDVNKKLDRFFKRTDLNNKTAIAIETDRLKEKITEKYNSFVKELNNEKKNLEEINGDKLDQLVEGKKEEITNVIKLFVEKIYSEYKEEFNPQLKDIIIENRELNEKVRQLENIKKDLVNNKVYSEDITRAENNFKKLLKETNKKFNKVNEKLNLISKKDNTRYNSLLAAINDTDTKEYETVLNNKIEQAELGQIKEELEQSLTSSMRSEVTSLKRYAEMSAGGGTNAKQYANGGTMDGNLNVTGELKADTILATTLLSAGTMDINFELSGFSVTGDLSANGQINGDVLEIRNRSYFDGKVNLNPFGGNALLARSRSSDNPAAPIKIEGPVTVGHDLFQRSGFTGGFADNSNHFHSLIDINRIEQEDEGDVKNIERIQERYYAVQGNFLPNNKAAFLAKHRVARSIDTSVVDTTTATLSVTQLQNSSNRQANSEAFFANNTTPAGKSEDLKITLAGHTFSTGDQVRMQFTQSFVGPIVAADLFGKVTNTTSNTFNVELYGGNYKTTTQVPLGTDQTALTFDEVVLETVGTTTIVNQSNQNSLGLYDKSNFNPTRTKNETLSAKWDTAHGLVKNEHITIITDGSKGDLVIQEDGYVLDPAPGGDNTSIILVYGRRQKQYDLSSFTAYGSTNWSIHKGSFDGIHRDVLGDNLINFNANNVGEYTAYQIGPGTQTDADAIAIGKNVYNKDASTIKIGYDNNMLNIDSEGIDVEGELTTTGTISAQDIIKSNRLNVGTGNLFVDDGSSTGNAFVKIGAYGQGTFFGKEGSVNGATFSLGVGSAGKIVEDMRIETFALSGAGLVNKNTNPVVLVASPGANKYIVPVSMQVYKSQSGSTRIPWPTGTGATAFGIGTFQNSNNTGGFRGLTALPRTTAIIDGDWMYNRNQGPDTTTQIGSNRDLCLRGFSDMSSNTSTDVIYLKVRYMIMSEDGDFKSIANLQIKDS